MPERNRFPGGALCEADNGCCYERRLKQVRGSIVVSGSIAQKPWQGGHTWAFLQYVLGFRKLGWNVLFLDQLEPEMCVDSQGRPCGIEESVNLRYFVKVMEQFGLTGAYSLI